MGGECRKVEDDKKKVKRVREEGSIKRVSTLMDYWLHWYMVRDGAYKDGACGGRMGLTDTPSLWNYVPHEACLNAASVSGGHASATQAVFQVVKAELLFQASAIWRLMHEVMDVAGVKV